MVGFTQSSGKLEQSVNRYCSPLSDFSTRPRRTCVNYLLCVERSLLLILRTPSPSNIFLRNSLGVRFWISAYLVIGHGTALLPDPAREAAFLVICKVPYNQNQECLTQAQTKHCPLYETQINRPRECARSRGRGLL